MTWDDIFNLATRLTKGEGKDHEFGFSFSTYQGGSPYYTMQQYYSALQLKIFDDKAEKMTVDSPQWEKVWSTISKLAIDKVIPKETNLRIRIRTDVITRFKVICS